MDFYLNDERRKFYDTALAHVRDCDDDFWDLDESLDKYVDSINANSNVRTMYSRKGKNRMGPGLESYLTICFTKKVENEIKNEIENDLKDSFNNKPNCSISIYHEPPKVETDNDEAAPYLKYIVHPDYWNVHHIKFEIKGGNSIDHEVFWDILTTRLSQVQ